MAAAADLAVTDAALRRQVATPPGAGGALAQLLSGARVPELAARIGARVAWLTGKPFRFKKLVVAVRHEHVVEMLARDLDFRIAPVNEGRILAVNGPFVLGMDRSATLEHERRALYGALKKVDIAKLMRDAAVEADALLDASGGRIDAVEGYARQVAGHTAQRLFGIAPADWPLFLDAVRAVFAHTFLNLKGDKEIEARALAGAALMRRWFEEEIARRRTGGALGDDYMGHLLEDGLLDDDGVRRTLGGMLVGSIDTTATSVAKILTVLDRDRALYRRARADARDPERIGGWCRDALRRWPHNPILLREAADDAVLAGVQVKKGQKVIAWTQAAMLDRYAFPDPFRVRPDRPASEYLHMGAGLHPCAGRPVNDVQIPMLVGKLLERGYHLAGKMDWAGRFPAHLPVKLGAPA